MLHRRLWWVHLHYEIRSRVREKYGAMYDIKYLCRWDQSFFLISELLDATPLSLAMCEAIDLSIQQPDPLEVCAYKVQITTLPSTPVELILVIPLPLSSKPRIVLMVFWCTVLSLVSSVPDLPLRSICLNMFKALSSR